MSNIHIVVNSDQLSKKVTTRELLAIQAGGFSHEIVSAMAKFCVDESGKEIPKEKALEMLLDLTIEELTEAAGGFGQKIENSVVSPTNGSGSN